MNLDFRQRTQCVQVSLLPSRCTGIAAPGDAGRKVLDPLDGVTRWQQPSSQLEEVKPLEVGALEGTVVEIESIHVHAGTDGSPLT